MLRFLVGVLVVALVACSSVPDATPPGEDGCTFEELPAEVTMRYRVSGGIPGRSTVVTAYADGRVEVQEKSDAPRVATVGVERVQRLSSELLGTGVEGDDQGCYVEDEDERSSDGIGTSLQIRRPNGGVLRYQGGGVTLPDALESAFDVARAFRDEVEPQAK